MSTHLIPPESVFPPPVAQAHWSLRPAASLLWSQVTRRLGLRPRSLDAIAERSWEACPGNMLTTLPAVYLPGQLERVTGQAYGYFWVDNGAEESIAYQMAGGIDRWQAPTRAWLLRDAFLADGSIHKAGNSHRLYPRASFLPPQRVALEIERAAVYGTFDGNQFFGLWLTDDCTLYPLAAAEGLPLTIGKPPSPHMAAYEESFAMQPVRADSAWLREVVVFDDRLQNAGKRARHDRLRQELLARYGLGEHPGVFIIRGASGKARKMHNELQLAEHFRTQHGFQVVDVNVDDMPKIMRACAGARMLAGVEGSHLVHGLMVLREGACVFVVQPPDRFCAVIKRTADRDGQHFGFVVGTPQGDGFSVDIEEVDRTLERFPLNRGGH